MRPMPAPESARRLQVVDLSRRFANHALHSRGVEHVEKSPRARSSCVAIRQQDRAKATVPVDCRSCRPRFASDGPACRKFSTSNAYPGAESMAVLHDSARPNLQQMLATTQLAALPQSAIRLLELSRDPNCGPADYAAPIEADPGLAGQVLKFVNSSYFGFSRKISSVKVGHLLGGRADDQELRPVERRFQPRAQSPLRSVRSEEHLAGLAAAGPFARAVAKLQGLKTTEEIFTAALLQDMAVPLLAKEFPQVYVKLLEGRNQGRRRLSNLESEAFGWTHGQAAGMLARQWNLPEEFAALIEGHAGGSLDSQKPASWAGRSWPSRPCCLRRPIRSGSNAPSGKKRSARFVLPWPLRPAC